MLAIHYRLVNFISIRHKKTFLNAHELFLNKLELCKTMIKLYADVSSDNN